MRAREKVTILLVVATIILGGLIFFAFRDNQVEANYFRWALAANLKQLLAAPSEFLHDELPPGSLLYGGLAIFAVGMTVFFLKMIRDGELQTLRKRLAELRTEKNEADSKLQEVVWKGKTERQTKELLTHDLEASIDKIETLIAELNAKEEELKARDLELMSLKAPAESPTEFGTGATDRMLRDELRKKNEIVQAKDVAIRDLEQRLTARTRQWETQLKEKDGLLRSRETELESLRSDFNEIDGRLRESESAKRRAENLLQEELKKTKEVLEANDQAIRAEEKRFLDKLKTLETQLGEKDKLLRDREVELNGFQRQLREVETAREQMEERLQAELRKSEDERRAKERIAIEVEQRLTANVHALRTEVGEKDLLLQVRDGELTSLKSEVKAISLRLSEMTAAKARIEETLHDELNRTRQQYEADKEAVREQGERYERQIHNLTAQLAERQTSLKQSQKDIEALKHQAQAISQKFEEVRAAKKQSEDSLHEQLKKERNERQSRDAAHRDVEERYGKEVQALKIQLGERNTFLKSRDEEIKSLKTQLGSLTEQLAKIGSAKERAASLLQQKLRAEKEGLQASDSALRQLEESFKSKIETLEEDLSRKEHLVGERDAEVAALRSELAAVNQSMADLMAARRRAEQLFEEAVKEREDVGQSKDTALRQLEEKFSAQLRETENRLREKEELLSRREAELSEFKNQLSQVATLKEEATRALHDELQVKAELVGERQATIRSMEERYSERIRALELEIGGKQELIEARDQEIKSLLSKVNAVAGELSDVEALKQQELGLAREEVKQQADALNATQAAMAALEKRLQDKARTLETQLIEKQELLALRDKDLDALMAKVTELTQQVSELAAERERSERLYQEQLREQTTLLESKESSSGEMEDRLRGRVEFLERQVAEKHKLLEASGIELSELRVQLNTLGERLDETEAAKVSLESMLDEERRKSDHALVMVETEDKVNGTGSNGAAEGLENLLNEREQLLQARDKLIQNLMSELKEKKTQLARQEIEVWQKIERREAWKHRLSKFGIRIKD